MVVEFKFIPTLTSEIENFAKADKEFITGLSKALQRASLKLNKVAKLANPQDTGTSRRLWGAPLKISPTKFIVRNKADYTPFIKYGKKKKSKYVRAPEGVTISPGKSFVKVTEEYFDEVSKELENKIYHLLTRLLK